MGDFRTWLEARQVAKDRYGLEMTDLEGEPVYTNPDGTIDMYHATDREAYAAIMNTHKWISKELGEVFFSNRPRGGEGFGAYVVHVRILPKYVRLNDAFHDGEVHFAVSRKVLEKFGKIVDR